MLLGFYLFEVIMLDPLSGSFQLIPLSWRLFHEEAIQNECDCSLVDIMNCLYCA